MVDLAACNDIVLLNETRTTCLERITEHMDAQHNMHFVAYHTDMGEGRAVKGRGVAVLVRGSISPHVNVWRQSKDLQALWLRIRGCMFGVEGDVCMGVVYVNPESNTRSGDVVAAMFDVLMEEVAVAQRAFTHVIVAGDFNAHIGLGDEFEHEHFDLIARFPCLGRPRMASGIRVPRKSNLAGRFLLDTASAGPMVLTTGRGRGDEGQRTFKGYDGQCRTRTDHVLMTGDLFEKLIDVQIDDECNISDHTPVQFRFPLVDSLEFDWGAEVAGREVDVEVKLRWSPDKEHDYGMRLREDDVGRTSVLAAIERGDVNGANGALMDMIERAAKATGMVVLPRAAPPRRYPAGRRRPVWFDAQCLEAKRRLRWAVKWGRARDQLVKEYKRVTRGAKRRFEQLRAARLLDMLKSKDPEAYRMLRQRTPKRATPIPAATWKQHIQQHFGQPVAEAVTQGGRHGLHRVNLDERGVPRDVVALGRHTLHGAQPGGGSFQLPDGSKLQGIVANHVRNMKVESAAGPDAVPVVFIRNARVRVGERCHDHVLVPLLCGMIEMCLRRGCMPERWKSARISPLHKKDDVVDPNNYRLLAVSSCMYRLYANVVRELMTDWCVAHRKIPDAQFGFFPGRNTLQPMFILRHLIHAAKHRKVHKKQVYAAFVDFSQAYDTVDRLKLWAHLEGIGMPTTLLQVVKGMYAGDTYELVDGENRTGHIRPARGVKQGCPLSPLLFSLFVNDVCELFPTRERGACGCGWDSPGFAPHVCRRFDIAGKHGRRYAGDVGVFGCLCQEEGFNCECEEVPGGGV
jgi:exonuclease III